MNNTNQTTRIAVIIALMLLAAFTRLIPHPANFTAILAVALFGGAKFKNGILAVLAPLVVMFITDLTYYSIQFGQTQITIGLYSLMPFVYGCIAVTALVGIYISRKPTISRIIGGSLFSSTLFFLVTNAAVWFHNPEFTQNVQGLISCYIIAIPFYSNQVMGDLFFSGVLFGAYALASRRVLALKTN